MPHIIRSPYGISSPLGIRIGHQPRHISILHHTLVHGHGLVYGDCVHRHEHRDQACTSCTQHARAREMQEMDARWTIDERNTCTQPQHMHPTLVNALNINYAWKQEQGRSKEPQPPANRGTNRATSQESQRGRATRQEQEHSHHTQRPAACTRAKAVEPFAPTSLRAWAAAARGAAPALAVLFEAMVVFLFLRAWTRAVDSATSRCSCSNRVSSALPPVPGADARPESGGI
jgi:hypothetical protein